MTTETLVRTVDGDLVLDADGHDPRCDGTGRVGGAGYDAQERPRVCRVCRDRVIREWDTRPVRGRRRRA